MSVENRDPPGEPRTGRPAEAHVTAPPIGGSAPSGYGEAVRLRPIRSREELGSLRIGDLSEWFNPLLKFFMSESLRSGGEVLVASEGETVEGVFLHDPVEGVGSVFARSPEIALEFVATRDHLAFFSELTLPMPSESYEVLSIETSAGRPTERFTHPVRAARPGDTPGLRRLMEEVHGRFNEGWLGGNDLGAEQCFVVDLDGRLVGAAWVSVVGSLGRFHSVSVSPRYRGLGIGSDLWRARLWWARRMGAERLIAEISTRNAPSIAIARRGGMRPVGRTYLYAKG